MTSASERGIGPTNSVREFSDCRQRNFKPPAFLHFRAAAHTGRTTDFYLANLAAHRALKLATFDGSINHSGLNR